ncbi:MAG: hypothetical protein COU11_01905 [Candidatus Harrisonbacteria bacterium CG10_big_fil_rev_8_21_14_0_10_49_15]|uniref:Uncharacterized protein n=1 Tax=Candidatus Harrisonbacteria bacterium CG10_big_fil_rev_8_21_14_0_10_49_15 TaxID=1974587 RepID=A0A2H0UL78_9BACT|nr:MAG: hypothetical protein COU11_01905 [Candidatus Harrisonbacteria bacterium CG10_big_fil_rev_8_21_14_0_10_49_15]
MIGDFIWTILALVGLSVLLVVIYALVLTHKIRKTIRSVTKATDMHPTRPQPKDVQVISSETVGDK